MKQVGIIVTFIAIVAIIASIIGGIRGTYQYEKKFNSYWSLADKASTIQKKGEYIDKFVEVLSKGGFEGKYNALVFTTPDNSFDANFEALKTLQQRLHEIEKMDITSFQYQTAISQITQQEQGEAHAMLSVFSGIWWKENHFMLWNWIAATQIVFFIVLGIVGIFIWSENSYY